MVDFHQKSDGSKCGLLLLLAAGFAVLGCSLFPLSSDAPAENNSFRATASSPINTLPVPIEVATDILKISKGQAINDSLPLNAGEKANSEKIEKTEKSEVSEKSENKGDNRGDLPTTAVANEPDEKCKCDAGHKPKPLPAQTGGKTVRYVVRSGDTLMKIAFEKYGNVYRWREILEANKDRIKNFSALVPGVELAINGVNYVVIERNGEPYLILKADSLVKISKKVYGTTSHWTNLWHNNPKLIHDPNKIYAGFTLYYQKLKDWTKPRLAKSLPVSSPGINKLAPGEATRSPSASNSNSWTPSKQ